MLKTLFFCETICIRAFIQRHLQGVLLTGSKVAFCLENMNDNGWVKLHRQIEENFLYFLEPFTKAQAWIDLFLFSNHADNTINIRGNIIPVKRGQIGWSELTMAKRWQWSRAKVRRFLNLLETRQQIVQQKSTKTTIITIKEYERFQETIQQTIQQKDSRRYTNKNVKKDKNSISKLLKSNFADINKIIAIFATENKTINYGNVTQRRACDNLIQKIGLERAVKVAEIAVKAQGEEFAPVVTTPAQLEKRYGDLKAWHARFYKQNNI